MNNQELELKVKEILAIENFFDMIEATIAFEKEYKGTEFFKRTKMPLIDVIKNSKAWYMLQFKDITNKVQSFLDNLSFDSINQVLNQLGDIYTEENEETLQMIKEFKEIVK